jgi:hypothetical protein
MVIMEIDIADKAFVKRWPDGRDVIATSLTEAEARIRIGDEYKVLSNEEWRRLPLASDEDRVTQGS